VSVFWASDERDKLAELFGDGKEDFVFVIIVVVEERDKFSASTFFS